MRYIIRNLLPGETIAYRTKQHWIVFIDSIFGLTVFSLLLFVSSYDPKMPIVVGLGGCIFSFFRFLYVLINYVASNYVVTNRRVIIKEGFFRIYSEEAQLNKIDGIHIEQNFLQRILNYGNITVESAGAVGRTYRNISNPMAFRINVNAQIRMATP